MKTLGTVLNEARLERKMTLRQLSDEVGLTIAMISDLENEKKIPLKGEALEKLSRFFNMEHEELLKIAVYTKANKFTEEKKRNPHDLQAVLARRIFGGPKLDREQIDKIFKILDKED